MESSDVIFGFDPAFPDDFSVAMDGFRKGAEGFAAGMNGMAKALASVTIDVSHLLDALEPHRVVRREALEIGVAPAVHEGWL